MLAEGILVKKLRRNPATVKGWRPITLLSCLVKGLEILLAKRMAHPAVTCDLIDQQTFSALSKHSATDLVSCEVHNVEMARSQR